MACGRDPASYAGVFECVCVCVCVFECVCVCVYIMLLLRMAPGEVTLLGLARASSSLGIPFKAWMNRKVS